MLNCLRSVRRTARAAGNDGRKRSAGPPCQGVAQPWRRILGGGQDRGRHVLGRVASRHGGIERRLVAGLRLGIGRQGTISLRRVRLDRRLGRPGFDHRDADAKAAHLVVQRLRIALDGVLARRIIGPNGPGSGPGPSQYSKCGRCLAPHDRQDRIGHPHDAQHIGIELLAHLFDRTFLGRPERAKPALLTRRSMPPSSATAWATAAVTEVSSVTSQAIMRMPSRIWPSALRLVPMTRLARPDQRHCRRPADPAGSPGHEGRPLSGARVTCHCRFP